MKYESNVNSKLNVVIKYNYLIKLNKFYNYKYI